METWPFAELTPLQRRDRERMESAMRAGTLLRWPAGMAVFAMAATLAACGGGDPEPEQASERVPAQPACVASGVCK